MKNKDRPADFATRMLLLCGATSSPFFILTFLVLGAIRIDYDSLRHPISSLSIGESGWMQMANFIITSLLILGFAIGVQRCRMNLEIPKSVPVLFGLVSIGLLGAGLFNTDPVYGYPLGKPFIMEQSTIHGYLHQTFSIVVFICLPSACFVMRNWFHKKEKHFCAVYSRFSGVAMLITLILSGFAFKQYLGLENIAGLIQRVSIVIGFNWIAWLAVYLVKKTFPKS